MVLSIFNLPLCPTLPTLSYADLCGSRFLAAPLRYGVTGFWLESQKEGDHWENLNVCDRIILKWILEKKNEVVQTRSICLRIRTNGGLL
jgi:hypothetical protein